MGVLGIIALLHHIAVVLCGDCKARMGLIQAEGNYNKPQQSDIEYIFDPHVSKLFIIKSIYKYFF